MFLSIVCTKTSHVFLISLKQSVLMHLIVDHSLREILRECVQQLHACLVAL